MNKQASAFLKFICLQAGAGTSCSGERCASEPCSPCPGLVSDHGRAPTLGSHPWETPAHLSGRNWVLVCHSKLQLCFWLSHLPLVSSAAAVFKFNLLYVLKFEILRKGEEGGERKPYVKKAESKWKWCVCMHRRRLSLAWCFLFWLLENSGEMWAWCDICLALGSMYMSACVCVRVCGRNWCLSLYEAAQYHMVI